MRLLLLSVVGGLLLSGCRGDRSGLRPVGEPAARNWSEVIDFPVLGLHIRLEPGRELFRDDGLFRGNLALHAADLKTEPEAADLTVSGRPAEGLLARGRGPDGVRRALVWAAATGDQPSDRARREGLRAAAAVSLGRRADLERYFLARNLRAQMQAVSDDVLVAMVELYALHLQGRPFQWGSGPERNQAAQLLMAMGVGEKP
ncbi:MAG TPA: hypothetical protein PK280_12565 [Planctomycetota bacterium]|nr:hypothetical protein [Planctomycetota bacterium]